MRAWKIVALVFVVVLALFGALAVAAFLMMTPATEEQKREIEIRRLQNEYHPSPRRAPTDEEIIQSAEDEFRARREAAQEEERRAALILKGYERSMRDR